MVVADGGNPQRMSLVADRGPVRLLQVHHVAASVAEKEAPVVQAVAQDVAHLHLELLLVIGHIGGWNIRDAGPVERPAFISRVNVDDYGLRIVLDPAFVRHLAIFAILQVAANFCGVLELCEADGTLRIVHIEIGGAAQAVNRLLEDGLGFGSTRIRHDVGGVLRARRRQQKQQGYPCNLNSHAKPALSTYPHSTAPPVTLSTSPVTKVARSDAQNRIGPAISARVPTRPSGIAEVANFAPALVASTGRDMSVPTQPGATQLTRMPWRASSVARDLTKLITAPLVPA